MDDGTQKELTTLLMMVDNWIRGYKTLLTGDGDEYLIADLREEINVHMMPYICRLRDTEYLTPAEMTELTNEIIDKVAKFEKSVTCKGCEGCDCGKR